MQADRQLSEAIGAAIGPGPGNTGRPGDGKRGFYGVCAHARKHTSTKTRRPEITNARTPERLDSLCAGWCVRSTRSTRCARVERVLSVLPPRGGGCGGVCIERIWLRQAWPFCRTGSSVRLGWELEESRGPKGWQVDDEQGVRMICRGGNTVRRRDWAGRGT